MAVSNLYDLFLHHLKDLYSAEQQITKALPKMCDAAQDVALQDAFEKHLKETEGHVKKLEEVGELLGESLTGVKCAGMEGLLKEGEEMIKETEGTPAADAGLISAAQKVEHYEIEGYGTSITWAKLMESEDLLKDGRVVDLLKEIMANEEETDKALTTLAEDGINEGAL